MSGASRPLACDLSALDPAGRRREQELLAQFRRAAREIAAGEHWVRFEIAADAATLAALAYCIWHYARQADTLIDVCHLHC